MPESPRVLRATPEEVAFALMLSVDEGYEGAVSDETYHQVAYAALASHEAGMKRAPP